MARWLKRSIAAEQKADVQAEVRATVERLLGDIASRGDAAVREMSARFDGWSRDDFRLTDAEIRACLAELPARVPTNPRQRGASPSFRGRVKPRKCGRCTTLMGNINAVRRTRNVNAARRARTSNLRFRRPTLYPAELRAQRVQG